MSRQEELFPTRHPDDPAAPEEASLPAGITLQEGFVALERCKQLMASLQQSVAWTQGEIVIFGKVTPLPRLTAWYGDEGAGYEYSGIRNEPLEWTAELARLRDEVGQAAGVSFNSVLLNLYRDGSDSVSWHSDDEPELGPDPTIASVSLGATRRFKLRHKATRETVVRDLEDGSLLLMSGNSQRLWEHCITKTRRPVGKRINLTFRVVGTEVQASPGVRLR
jgi:alkylated DNA repair dioxygenase AlkB